MNISGWTSNPSQPVTSPFPIADGWFFALRTGDFFSVKGEWAKPEHVYRGWCIVPRPFVSFRRGSFGFYLGWKAWGPSDPESFKYFPGINPNIEVFPGSVCLQGLTIRFTTKCPPSVSP